MVNYRIVYVEEESDDEGMPIRGRKNTVAHVAIPVKVETPEEKQKRLKEESDEKKHERELKIMIGKEKRAERVRKSKSSRRGQKKKGSRGKTTTKNQFLSLFFVF